MSAHQNNFFPTDLALATNGQWSRPFPSYIDINQLDLTWMQPVTYTNPNGSPGNTNNGFEFMFYDKKRIRYDSVLFGTTPHATVDAWLNFLNGIGFCPLTKYVNYVAIGRRSLGQTIPAILVNDQKVIRRVYNPSPGSNASTVANSTDLYLDAGNTLRRTILTVLGDQTIAGGYYYGGTNF